MATPAEALFALGQETLSALVEILAGYGVSVDPDLELRRGAGFLSHYSFADRQIYLSVPDGTQPQGKFTLFFLRSVLAYDNDEEVLRLIELLIPWLIAHEVGHHLRQRYGRLDYRLWDEEMIANQLAGAYALVALTAHQRQELLSTLSRAIANVSTALDVPGTEEEVNPAQDLIGYVYRHMCWFQSDLAANQNYSIGQFVRVYIRSSE